LSFAILASMKVLGVTLIAAAIVVPAVTARMLTNSFARMLWLSTVIGGLQGLVGMYLSYHLDVSSGATIVLVGFALFAVVFTVSGHQARRRITGLDDHRAAGGLVVVSPPPAPVVIDAR